MPTLTLFTSPKPFTNPHIAVIQRNAIRSWLNLGAEVEVLLLGEEEGLAEDGAATLSALDSAIQAVTGVNMDEELIDMLAAQRAFQACARVVTTVDQMLDHIINRMAY